MNDVLATRVAAEMTDTTAVDAADAPYFLLRSPQQAMEAQGVRARLPSGATATLAERVAAFFAAPRSGPRLLVGAVPFDPEQGDALYQPDRVSGQPTVVRVETPTLVGDVCAEPTADAYAQAVAAAVTELQRTDSPLEKVVLARSLRVTTAQPLHPRVLAARLGKDPSVATYVVPVPTADPTDPAWLVGATPELLVSRRGNRVLSHPLAGSARRSADPAEDARAAEALLASGKDHDEHRHVVEAIVAALAPLCHHVEAQPRPTLHATATMWHLGTRIHGTLKDASVSAAALVALLHPTPAVCGTPRQPALELIRQAEPVARGFYAGAVGWTDAQGDGDWYVAIRCARVQGTEVRLYAGAGVVAESQPELEVAETAAKFMALLTALGVHDVRPF
jgi:isochorismate synthase